MRVYVLLSSLAICLKSNEMSFCHFLHIKFSLHLLKMSVYFAMRTEFFFIQFQLNVSTLLSSNSMIFLSYFFFVQFSLFFFLNIVLWPKKIKLKKMWSFWIALTLINQSSLLLSSVSCVCVNQFHTDMMAMPIMVETQRLHR